MDMVYEPTNDGYWSFSDDEPDVPAPSGSALQHSQAAVLKPLAVQGSPGIFGGQPGPAAGKPLVH